MILEDRATDQTLVKRQVLKYNSKSVFSIASDKASFLKKIDWFLPDLILADYNLPQFTGLEALVHVKENKPFVPFVFVTGGLHPSDPVAGVVLKLADGFVLKDNLSSLHKELVDIMKSMDDKIKYHAKITQKQYEKKVQILKNIELLDELTSEEKQQKINELLEGLN